MKVDVWLLGFEANGAEPPAQALRRVFGLDAQEALTLELTVPTAVQTDVEEAEAERLVLVLRGIGGRAEARATDVAAIPGFQLVLPPLAEPARAGSRFPPPVGVTPIPPGSAPAPSIPRAPAVPHFEPLSPAPVPRRAPRGTGPRPQLRPEELQVVDVRPTPARRELRVTSSTPASPESRDWTRYLPLVGSVLVGVAALASGLMRGASSLLATADSPFTLLLDGVAFAAAAVFFLSLFCIATRRVLPAWPVLGFLAVGVLAAYGVDRTRQPTDTELISSADDSAETLLESTKVHFAGLTRAAAAQLVTDLRGAGALSVRAVGLVHGLGYSSVHGLRIELPPGPVARGQIARAYLGAMGGSAARLPPGMREPGRTPSSWVVRLGSADGSPSRASSRARIESPSERSRNRRCSAR